MSEELYYIQNVGFWGDCLLWWRPDGNGYTLDLNHAWKVTREKADRICRLRPAEDIAWPVDRVDAIASRHVNSEDQGWRTLLDERKAGRTAKS